MELNPVVTLSALTICFCLAAYLERSDWKSRAEKLLSSFSERLEKIPIAVPEMMSALLLYHDSLSNVLIVGPRDDSATQRLLDVTRGRLMLGRTLVLADGPQGPSALLYDRLDILKKLKMVNNKPTAYICHHHSCSLPVNEPEELLNLLDEELKVYKRQSE